MDLGALGAHLQALAVYPGFALTALTGAGVEAGVARATGGAAPAWRALLTPRTVLIAAMGAVAAVQTSIPFNPLPAAERSVLVGALALAGAGWLGADLGAAAAPRPARFVVAQAGLVAALLSPALAAGTMQPADIGLVVVPAALVVKVAAAFLYVLCLPAVLGLVAGADIAAAAVPARMFLWLPACGLAASVFLPAPGPDAAGLARFAAEALLFGLGAAAVAMAARRRPMRGYWVAVPVLAAATLAAGAAAALAT